MDGGVEVGGGSAGGNGGRWGREHGQQAHGRRTQTRTCLTGRRGGGGRGGGAAAAPLDESRCGSSCDSRCESWCGHRFPGVSPIQAVLPHAHPHTGAGG
eukprot:28666-Chlamydomonas_euryale.AAC.2